MTKVFLDIWVVVCAFATEIYDLKEEYKTGVICLTLFVT